MQQNSESFNTFSLPDTRNLTEDFAAMYPSISIYRFTLLAVLSSADCDVCCPVGLWGCVQQEVTVLLWAPGGTSKHHCTMCHKNVHRHWINQKLAKTEMSIDTLAQSETGQ